MKISVALALYNSNEYLMEQLDSLKNQSRPADEVILVDDASTNDTVETVRKYIEENGLDHWKLICQPKNRGFIETFRHALKECSGDVIFLCDHDDIWMPQKIQVMTDVFEKSNGKVQALAASFIPVDKNNSPIETKAQKGKSNNNLLRKSVPAGSLTPIAFQDLAAYNVSPGCTAAITRELAQAYMPFEEKLPHDWALFAIAALQNGMYYLDRPLVRYRLHDSNTLGLTRQKAWENRSRIAKIDADQKTALLELAAQYEADEQTFAYMKQVRDFYAKRAEALAGRKAAALSVLLLKSRNVPFLYETLAADLLSAARSLK
mgnify:FL=1